MSEGCKLFELVDPHKLMESLLKQGYSTESASQQIKHTTGRTIPLDEIRKKWLEMYGHL
jgi:hypothetical protein